MAAGSMCKVQARIRARPFQWSSPVLTPIDGDGEKHDQPVDREPELAVSSHRRVLLVDDHQDTCIGMKRMLERRGYEITVAYSAEQAAEKVRTQDFDLLISDIGLPDRSGY